MLYLVMGALVVVARVIGYMRSTTASRSVSA